MANENEQGFAISCPDGLWVTGIVEAGGKRRLVLGIEGRKIYPTWAAACSELDHMCRPDEDGYRIVELGAADGYEEHRAEESV